MATERGSAGEGRVAPDEKLVVGMAVGGEELSVLGRPHQTTDLVWVVFVEGRGRGGRGGEGERGRGEREVGYIAVIELV